MRLVYQLQRLPVIRTKSLVQGPVGEFFFFTLNMQCSCRRSYTNVQCIASCTDNYEKSYFSNYGTDITIVAPGERIESASHLDDDSVVVRSGTSYASAHVAGVMATIIGYESISNDVVKVIGRLHDNIQTGLLGPNFAPNTVDRLVNTGMQNPGKNDKVPYFGAPEKGFPEDANGEPGAPILTVTTTDLPVSTAAIPVDPFEGPEPGQGTAFTSNSVTITIDAKARRTTARPTLS